MKKPGKMLAEVLNHIFKKPATINYPFEKVQMPAHFRGKLKFEAEKCIGCKLCMRDCPASAITITKLGEKLFEARLDMDKCIYCSQCVFSCGPDALSATDDYELAQLKRQGLSVIINEKPITKEMIAEAKRLAEEKAQQKKLVQEAAALKAEKKESEPA